MKETTSTTWSIWMASLSRFSFSLFLVLSISKIKQKTKNKNVSSTDPRSKRGVRIDINSKNVVQPIHFKDCTIKGASDAKPLEVPVILDNCDGITKKN